MNETNVALLVDQARSIDPTNTAGLRRSFRAAAKLRLRQLRAQMRVAVMEHDVLGFGGPKAAAAGGSLAFQPAETRLKAFAGWFQASAGQMLGGPWLSWYVAQAWAHGAQAGAKQTGTMVPPEGGGSGGMYELAKVELDGILGALLQAVTREAAKSLSKARPQRQLVWRRIARAFDKVGPPRVSALANTFCVMCHNKAKLAQYRAVGVDRVGVIPEIMPPHMAFLKKFDGRVTDARKREPPEPKYIEDPEYEVGIRTAGDHLVCDECDAFAEGSPYYIDEAEEALPIHPNCRCTWFPWSDKRFRHDAKAAGRPEEKEKP